MKKLLSSLILGLLVLFVQLTVQAQTGAIGGTVSDANGAVVPGATVTVKGSAGQEYTVTTASNGTFVIPAVASGKYTVTVTAPNFKTAITENVKVDVGTPTAVDVSLQAGKIEETVLVVSGGEVLQTQTATVGTTITGRQITDTPLTSRDALDLVTLLPGTATVGRPRQSTINGLPKGSLSITIDGVDVQDNLLRSSDGFFTYVRPRLDAVEEVSVSTASPGAESSGDGAVTIKFVTKRGTNRYAGNLFWQHRDVSFDSNYWWNNALGAPRNPLNLNQYGGSFGGPIPFLNFGEGVPIVTSGKDKAFFFVNYEEFRLPESASRTRRILNPTAQGGSYSYVGTDGVTRSINVLNLAGGGGFPTAIDPTVGSLLTAIRASTSQGTLAALGTNYQNLTFFNLNKQVRKFTALRFDFNLTKKHSIENVTNYQTFKSPSDFLNNVDPIFPGFPNYGSQNSDRYSNTTALRSTITNNLVNEARFSFSGGLSLFRENLDPKTVFANMAGWFLSFNPVGNDGSQPLGLASPAPTNSNNRRVSPTFDFTDNMTWTMGSHSISFGGQYKRIKLNSASVNFAAPQVFFGMSSTIDSALSGLFNTTNFPSSSATQRSEASALYSMLTGRVYQISGNAYLTDDQTYKFLGDQRQRGKLNTYGLYVQDAWRAKPNLLINFGVRWQPQEAFQTTSENFARASSFADVYGVSGLGNLFKPGTLTGAVPTFYGTPKGYRAFDTDWNNIAPSVGVVWSPNFDGGIGHALFGGRDKSVIRGGYSISFVREGTNVLTSILGSNPGASLTATRAVVNAAATGIPQGTLLQSLNVNSYVPPTFLATPAYPIAATDATSTNVFDPNLKSGNVHSFSFGYQRELDKNTVVEVRYVGNRGRDLWRQYNINEFNVTENGFAAEFRLAMANLVANNLAGGSRANSFAYFGVGTGTSPLPNILAYANGTTIAGGGANTAANYPTAFFTNAALRTFLNPSFPNAIGFAGNVNGVAGQRTNAINAGLAKNYFIVNPDSRGGGSFLVDNSGHSWYDSAVVEFRRRFSQGLSVQANYTYAKSRSDAFGSSAVVAVNYVSLRNRDLNKTISPFDVRHAFKLSAAYELPFGTGKMFGGGVNRWTNALIGGWSLIPVVRWQSGTPINFGNVQLVGMDRNELEHLVKKVYFSQTPTFGTGANQVTQATFLPADIISDTRKAFSLTTAPTGTRFIAPASYGGCLQEYAGQCGFSNLVVHGPNFLKFDLSISKKFKFDEKRNVELRAAMYNAWNNAAFRVGGWGADVVSITPNSTDFGLYTNGTVYQDTSTTNDPGGRIIELILRINF